MILSRFVVLFFFFVASDFDLSISLSEPLSIYFFPSKRSIAFFSVLCVHVFPFIFFGLGPSLAFVHTSETRLHTHIHIQSFFVTQLQKQNMVSEARFAPIRSRLLDFWVGCTFERAAMKGRSQLSPHHHSSP
jgi:hypothetical protein